MEEGGGGVALKENDRRCLNRCNLLGSKSLSLLHVMLVGVS